MLLNYCGVRADLVDYALDSNPHKQGRLLPGVDIPIYGPDRAAETRPDYVLILPWNMRDEVMSADGRRPVVGRTVRGAGARARESSSKAALGGCADFRLCGLPEPVSLKPGA